MQSYVRSLPIKQCKKRLTVWQVIYKNRVRSFVDEVKATYQINVEEHKEDYLLKHIYKSINKSKQNCCKRYVHINMQWMQTTTLFWVLKSRNFVISIQAQKGCYLFELLFTA